MTPPAPSPVIELIAAGKEPAAGDRVLVEFTFSDESTLRFLTCDAMLSMLARATMKEASW